MPGEADESALEELSSGIAFWRTRSKWPSDFHSREYTRWAAANPDGDFTDEWWQPFQRQLAAWIAIRPAKHSEVTTRFVQRRDELRDVWLESCRPYRHSDITEVTWEQVGPFADLVGSIKPMRRNPSAVFTSKFCHFLLPKVFPVVDNAASGGARSYRGYFEFVQNKWAQSLGSTQQALVAEFKQALRAGGGELHDEFPVVNKIVELMVIGRKQPRSRES